MSRPFTPRGSYSPNSLVKVNGKIRAREVRVIGIDGHQMGVFPLAEAINMARGHGVDLVEIAPNAAPPVCRLIDFGKFRYEQAKKDKEAKKHQHANRVKEIQLSASIDPHDFGVKLSHAVDFLCEDMKVKISLRFRGREMAHTEVGYGVVDRFIKDLAPFGHPDAPPKLIGKGLNVMMSPHPRNKRAKNPRETGIPIVPPQSLAPLANHVAAPHAPSLAKPIESLKQSAAPNQGANQQEGGFVINPFTALDHQGAVTKPH